MIIFLGIFIFVVVVAVNYWFGLWNNILTLINFFIAALFASSYYENFAAVLIDKMPTYEYLVDFLALWLLFFLTLLLLRAVTGALTHVQLKFNFWVDMVGRGVVCCWLALAFLSFASFSLHLAPISPVDEDNSTYQAELSTEEFAATVAVEDVRGFLGLDRFWMAFIQSRSRGALSASHNSMIGREYDLEEHPDDEGLDCRVFDPFSRFAQRREHVTNTLATQETLRSEK